MKKILSTIAMLSIISLIFTANSYANNKWGRLILESGRILEEMQMMPDQSIPEDLMKNCQAICIFPNTFSAGFIIGGKYGQGVMLIRDENTGKWSSPAIFTIAGGSLGWQIGAQATDIILLIMNKRSIDAILDGKFKLGADASVAAGPLGRNAEVSTDIQLKGSIFSYSRSRGLFAGAKIEGAVISQEWEADSFIYGKSYSAREIMMDGMVKTPKSAGTLLKILNQYPSKNSK